MQYVEKKYFPTEVECQVFIANSTSEYWTKLGLSPSERYQEAQRSSRCYIYITLVFLQCNKLTNPDKVCEVSDNDKFDHETMSDMIFIVSLVRIY